MTEMERLVLSTLEDLTGRSLGEADLDLDFTQDLKITSDDLSFVFVVNLERAAGVRVPPREWQQVSCGRQAANLLRRHLP